jgi:hypothetical protein
MLIDTNVFLEILSNSFIGPKFAVLFIFDISWNTSIVLQEPQWIKFLLIHLSLVCDFF